MRWLVVLLAVIFALSFSACSGDGGKQLYETAAFEEIQKNREHAKELYEEIVKKYPGSDYAKKAEARLKELSEKR
jgi:TolA-binding protein